MKAPSYYNLASTFALLATVLTGMVVLALGNRLEASLRQDELISVERILSAVKPERVEDLAVWESALSWERHVVHLSWQAEGVSHPWQTTDASSETLCLPASQLGGGCVLAQLKWIPGLSMLGTEAIGMFWLSLLAIAAGLVGGFHWLVSRRLHGPLVATLAMVEKSESKARSLDMVIHDLRKPMRAIRETLGEASLKGDGRTAEVVRELCETVDDLITDVDEMLRSAGTTNSPTALDSAEKLSVENLILDAFRQCAALLQKTECGFAYRLKHVRMVEGDPSLLGRMLANLVGNALEAVEARGEVWFASDEVMVEARPMLKFTVGNTGRVIEAEDQARVFGAFFTKGKIDGTGLGLAFVRLVVESHGGRVTVRSSQESGTEFTVTIPLAAESLSKSSQLLPATSKEAVTQLGVSSSEVTGGRTLVPLLLVEDDVFVREAWMLGCLDADLFAVNSPEEVLAKMERDTSFLNQFVAVVTDYYFDVPGGLNGAQFAAKIRRHFSGPIILTSTTSMSETEGSTIDLRIGKEPCSWAELSERLLASVKSVGVRKLG